MPRAVHAGSADALEAASAEFLYLAAWADRNPWGYWRALRAAGNWVYRKVHRSNNRSGTLQFGLPPKGRPSTLSHQGTFFGRQRPHSRPDSEEVRGMALTWPMEFRIDVRVVLALPSKSLSRDSFYGVEAPEQALIFRYPQSG